VGRRIRRPLLYGAKGARSCLCWMLDRLERRTLPLRSRTGGIASSGVMFMAYRGDAGYGTGHCRAAGAVDRCVVADGVAYLSTVACVPNVSITDPPFPRRNGVWNDPATTAGTGSAGLRTYGLLVADTTAYLPRLPSPWQGQCLRCGVRSRLPLLGSPGLSPGSLLRALPQDVVGQPILEHDTRSRRTVKALRAACSRGLARQRHWPQRPRETSASENPAESCSCEGDRERRRKDKY
jgi:hypothetical protein